MRMKKVGIILYLSMTTIVCLAGGWPQPKGSGYYKLGQNWIISDSFYGPKGDIVSIRTTSLYTTSFYGEYGITKRLTGILYFPFFVRSTLNKEQYSPSGTTVSGEALNSIGDTDIAFKYGLIVDKPVVLSATLSFGIPIGETSGGKSGVLQTGDGEFNQMIRFDASTSFYPAPIYASAYIGFNNRTNDFSDEFRFGAEVGYTFFKKLTTIVKLNVVQSLNNGGDQVADNGIFSNNTEYVSPMVEVGYALNEKWGLSCSGGFAFAGQNILASPNYGVGVYLKL
jgi:protein XagA